MNNHNLASREPICGCAVLRWVHRGGPAGMARLPTLPLMVSLATRLHRLSQIFPHPGPVLRIFFLLSSTATLRRKSYPRYSTYATIQYYPGVASLPPMCQQYRNISNLQIMFGELNARPIAAFTAKKQVLDIF
jgi:hypothetical protein